MKRINYQGDRARFQKSLQEEEEEGEGEEDPCKYFSQFTLTPILLACALIKYAAGISLPDLHTRGPDTRRSMDKTRSIPLLHRSLSTSCSIDEYWYFESYVAAIR